MPIRFSICTYLTIFLSSLPFLQGQTEAAVPLARSTLEEWVLAEKTLSAEAEAWAAERATMEDIIALLQTEKGHLEEAIGEAETGLTEAGRHRSKLLEERKTLQDAIAALTPEIEGYETRLRRLAPSLPPPLIDTIQPLLRRLPRTSGDTRLSPAQRMQTVIGILGEIDKFNREVTLDTRVQALPDGRSAEVSAIYFGLGTAYFVDVSGQYAGTLTPAPEGWVAKVRPELATRISRLIAQYQRQEPATLVNLPVSLP